MMADKHIYFRSHKKASFSATIEILCSSKLYHIGSKKSPMNERKVSDANSIECTQTKAYFNIV